MQVLRNTYNSRRLAYEDDAYNLPLDTIYFIESTWNYRLNKYVSEHQEEIRQLLEKYEDGLYQYKFEIISIANLHNPHVQQSLKELHPELDADIDYTLIPSHLSADIEQVYQTAMMQRLTAKQPIFEESFMARILPSEYDDTYDFYAIDISLCSESLILDIFEKYLHDLNYTNLSILGEQEFWRDYNVHDEVLSARNDISFGGDNGQPCGILSQEEIVHSFAATEIDKLNINPQLRDLALKIKDEVDSYQRTNGVNVLLENMCEEFLKSFENIEVKPLSSLEIDNTYNIYLKEYKKEIKMHTLPKTLYIFFLRHPQGIYLKDISDHRDELLHIYRLLTRQGYSLEESQAKIDKMLDFTSNGNLNQYMSRISEAFRNELSTNLAKKYTISGKRNEIRYITLDAAKIILPEKLKF